MGRIFSIGPGTIEAEHVAAEYKDGAADVPSLRTLGTGSTQAAAGDHSHAGGGLSDGTMGDVTVTGGGTSVTVDKVNGVTPSSFALTLFDDADAATARGTIGAAASSHTHAASDITSGLATVATTGAYADLSGKPTLGTAAAANTGTGASDVPTVTQANGLYVPLARTVSTSGQLSGGGALSGDLSIVWTDPWTYVWLAADFATTNNVAQNVDNGSGDALKFTPAASKTYIVEGSLFVQASGGTPGSNAPRPGLSWPSGLSYGYVRMDEYSGVSTTLQQMKLVGNTAGLLASSLTDNTAGYPCLIWAHFVSGGSPSGNFQVLLASEANGSTVTMNAGSYFRYRTKP